MGALHTEGMWSASRNKWDLMTKTSAKHPKRKDRNCCFDDDIQPALTVQLFSSCFITHRLFVNRNIRQ